MFYLFIYFLHCKFQWLTDILIKHEIGADLLDPEQRCGNQRVTSVWSFYSQLLCIFVLYCRVNESVRGGVRCSGGLSRASSERRSRYRKACGTPCPPAAPGFGGRFHGDTGGQRLFTALMDQCILGFKAPVFNLCLKNVIALLNRPPTSPKPTPQRKTKLKPWWLSPITNTTPFSECWPSETLICLDAVDALWLTCFYFVFCPERQLHKESGRTPSSKLHLLSLWEKWTLHPKLPDQWGNRVFITTVHMEMTIGYNVDVGLSLT